MRGLLVLLGCLACAPTQPAAPPVPPRAHASVVAPEPEPAPAPAPPAPPEPPATAPIERAPLELALVGDMIFSRYAGAGHYTTLAEADAFDQVTDILAADLVLGNLETPIADPLPARPYVPRGHRFGAPRAAAQWLAAAGFSAVSIANNHALDLGEAGLRQTAGHLEQAHVRALGRPAETGPTAIVETLEVHGWRVAIVAATTWLNAQVPAGAPVPPIWPTRALVRNLAPVVEAAARDHDLVIVSLHWGKQFAPDPDAAQRIVARALVAAGADLVWGHHPHVLQGVEWFDDALVAYSLGNFVFYEIDDPASRDSAVLRLSRAPDGGWTSVHIVPVRIGIDRRPAPARGEVARSIRERVRAANRRLGTRTRNGDAGQLIVDRDPASVPADALSQR